ncbi:6145_t:CDS:2 [Funneliformis mosseae]|uniref:6145_t:CDS:1 n=1 Tax=Funneliformis mosseae TaxID=27381 RepID=A0A9N8ZD21_FUNMO|nr:6145_t:CDS:2 [Funneliformis mosseae]
MKVNQDDCNDNNNELSTFGNQASRDRGSHNGRSRGCNRHDRSVRGESSHGGSGHGHHVLGSVTI